VFWFESTLQKLSETGCSVDNIDKEKRKNEVCGVFDELQSVKKQDKLLFQQYDVIKPKVVQVDAVFVMKNSRKMRKLWLVPKQFY